MEFLSQTYVALRGPTGVPQTAQDTIGRLADRLSPSTLLADRRAAVLSLKGLARDHKQDIGERALDGLLEVLENDAEIDGDIAKGVLETLHALCDTEDAKAGSKELGFKHTDQVLASDRSTHKFFSLLADSTFYVRFATLQLLASLLQNRRQVVQGYFLKAPAGPSSVISVLEDKREIIRNGESGHFDDDTRATLHIEAMVMVQSLISQSADIQKVLAFEGAFEKLFNTVRQEGGVEGGVVVQDALACVDGLLRYNTSNQVGSVLR
jgi:intracellular protein transport protein USO1